MADSLALTRTNGGPPKAVPEVPAFLNKLYTMVDDPSTDDIIRWSDDGESFYILSQDELGKQVLGSWFKHNKFSSFVRQLNMYGFHKMQQIKQGALKNTAEDEIWQFQEPNFRRGRLDLLKLITRKKGTSSSAVTKTQTDADALEFVNDTEATLSHSQPSGSTHHGTGTGIVAVNSLAEQLQIIKRNQSTLVNDLKQLQISNSQLWKETLAGQAAAKKQQDTINRIIKFLSGVFGNQAHGARTSGSAASDDGVGEPRSPEPRPSGRQLLIEDGRGRGEARSKELIRLPSASTKEQFDSHRFVEANSPLDGAPFIEEIDSPKASDTPSSSSLIARRTPSRAPSRLGRSQPATTPATEVPDPTHSQHSSNTTNDGPGPGPTFADLLSSSPNLFLAALSQMQNADALGLGGLGPDTTTFPSNPPNLDPTQGMGMNQTTSSNPTNLPVSFPSPNLNTNLYLPTSPRFPYAQPTSTSISSSSSADTSSYPTNPQQPGGIDSLYFPYDLNPALAGTTSGLEHTISNTQSVQAQVDQAQMGFDSLMREIMRLNPNAFNQPLDANTLGNFGGAFGGEFEDGNVSSLGGGARVEEMMDHEHGESDEDAAMLNEIGLPSVGSAVANVAAGNGNTSGVGVGGVNGAGVGVGVGATDYDSFFHSLGEGRPNASGPGAVPIPMPTTAPASSGTGLHPDTTFDPSQFLQSDAFESMPLNNVPAPAPAPQPQAMTPSNASAGNGVGSRSRAKRKSDASMSGRPSLELSADANGTVNGDGNAGGREDGGAGDGEPPTKKLRSRRKLK